MQDVVYLNEKTNYNELVLNRPKKLNAISEAMVIKLHQILKLLNERPAKILLIKGAGNHFSSGHDIDTVISKETFSALENQIKMLQEITEMIVDYDAPVISYVEGYALGAGGELAINSDLVYAEENAVFGFPELDVGLSVTQGSSNILQKLVGPQRAKELIYFRKNICAKEAYDIGLINGLVSGDGSSFIEDKINELSKVKLRSLSNIKQLFNYSYEHSLSDSMKKESEILISLLR